MAKLIWEKPHPNFYIRQTASFGLTTFELYKMGSFEWELNIKKGEKFIERKSFDTSFEARKYASEYINRIIQEDNVP